MESEINESELLVRCVRCHKSNRKLTQFKIRKLLGIQGAKYYSIKYSICEMCKPYFEKGLKVEDKYRSVKLKNVLSRIYLVITIVAIIIFFISNFSFIGFLIGVPILMGSTIFLLFLISYLNRVRYKTNPENINKYFEIRKDGIVILKDLESNSEIKRINLLSIEKKIGDVLPRKSYEFCPNCGSQIKTYTGFCQSCGKNLKL